MIVLGIILWILVGAVSVWRFYHGMLKSFYEEVGHSMWEEQEGKDFFKRFFIRSIIFVLSGGISLLVIEGVLPKGFTCWYFTTKNK